LSEWEWWKGEKGDHFFSLENEEKRGMRSSNSIRTNEKKGKAVGAFLAYLWLAEGKRKGGILFGNYSECIRWRRGPVGKRGENSWRTLSILEISAEVCAVDW